MYKITSMKGSKKTAWDWLSKVVRLEGALQTTGNPEYCQCYTCKKTYPIDQIHAGHGIPGRKHSILFDKDIIKPQCYTCNVTNGGEYQVFKMYLIEEHSVAWFEEKERKKLEPHVSDKPYKLIADHYRREYKKLLNEC